MCAKLWEKLGPAWNYILKYDINAEYRNFQIHTGLEVHLLCISQLFFFKKLSVCSGNKRNQTKRKKTIQETVDSISECGE